MQSFYLHETILSDYNTKKSLQRRPLQWTRWRAYMWHSRRTQLVGERAHTREPIRSRPLASILALRASAWTDVADS